MSRTISPIQKTILNEIKEYNEPISIDQLVSLGSLKKSSVLYAINALHKNRFIDKRRKAKKGNIFFYTIRTEKPKVVTPKKINNHPYVKQPEYVPINHNKPILNEMDIQQRCYHLLMAGRSKSSGAVADFFNVSEDQAVRLLRGLAKKYPNEIKIDILARVI